MTEQGLGAIVLEGGTSMSYFVNVRWGLSEHPFLVIPPKGDVAYIAPGFEERRAREVIRFSTDVRVWPRLPPPKSARRASPSMEFGVRLEDCLCITPDGPRFFTQPSPAIDRPFA